MRKILVGIFLTFLAFTVQAATKTIDQVVVFGDSLSDNGNSFALHGDTRPLAPYYFGRYSNGILWVEILTEMLGLSPNHLEDDAVAGAQTYGTNPPGLKEQVDSYVYQHPTLNPHAIYIIWSGGDNLLDNPSGNLSLVDGAIDDVHLAVNELAAHGAQYFLIPNLPDVGSTPFARMLDKTKPRQKLAANLTKLSQEYNKRLAVLLPKLQNTLSVNIMTVDIYYLMHDVMSDPAKYGMTNANDACYIGSFTGGKGHECDTPDTYLFWDLVHPTNAGHEQIAMFALESLQAGGVA